MNKATMIYGPQGSGKGLRAAAIAESFKQPVWIDAEKLFGRFGTGAIPDRADVVIVDDFVGTAHNMNLLKTLVSCDRIVINRKHQATYERSRPHFIVCTGDPVALAYAEAGRRFEIVNIAG